MKQFYYMLTLLLMITMVSEARSKRVGVRTEKYSTSSYKYPQITLPSKTTYDFQIIVPYGLQTIPPSLYLATEMNLLGWTREMENPEMLLSLYLDEPRMGPEELLTRYEVKKDSVTNKKGKRVLRIDTTFFYSYRVSLQARSKLVSTDVHGNVIATDYTNRFCTERKTREFRNCRAALRDLRGNVDYFFHDMIMEWYNIQVQESKTIANNKYGYYEYNTMLSLKKISNKRHPEYANFNSQVEQVSTIMNTFRPTQNKRQVMKEIRKYIWYFDQVEKKYLGKRRNDRKMRSMALQNKAHIYEILDEYQNAQSEVSRWVATGIDERQAKHVRNRLRFEERDRALNYWDF